MSTPYLDVAIGLALIYLTFAISVTSLNEALSSLMKLRGRLLRERLRQLFGKEDADALLKDPLLASLSASGLPSYIPARSLGSALLRANIEKPTPEAALEGLKSRADSAASEAFLEPILSDAIKRGQTAWEGVEARLEGHLNDVLDRLAGNYARMMKLMSLVFAVILVLAANLDTIRIANEIMADDVLRASLVEAAEDYTDIAGDPGAYSDAGEQILRQAAGQLPIGWSCIGGQPKTHWPDAACGGLERADWIRVIFGWALSALAIMLGAPFWFGVLQRATNIRGTGKKPY